MFGVRCLLSSVNDLLSYPMNKNSKGNDWEKAKTQTEVWVRSPFITSIFSLE